MTDTLGDAVLHLRTDDSALASGLARAQQSTQSFTQRAGQAFKKMGTAMSVGFTLPMVFAAKAAAAELGDIQAANAGTAAAIERVGKASGVTADQVRDLAGALQEKSGFDDQAIQNGQNLLLTIGNISDATGRGREVFALASETMVDLAAAMGTDAAGAGKLLGKALADPMNSMSKLGKAVGLTKDQMADMKTAMAATNDPAERQAILLDALQGKIGAYAETAGGTAAAKMAVMKDKLVGVGAAMLESLMPQIEAGIGFMSRLASAFDSLSPTAKRVAAIMMAVAVAIGPVAGVVSAVIAVGSALGAVFAALASPIGIVVALGAALAVAWARMPGNMDKLRAVVARLRDTMARVFGWIRDEGFPMVTRAAQVAVGWLQSNVLPPVAAVLRDLAATVRVWLGAAQAFWKAHGAQVMGALRAVFSRLAPIVGGYLRAMSGIVRAVLAVLRGDWRGAWEALKGAVRAALGAARAVVSAQLAGIKAVVSAAWGAIRNATVGEWNRITGAVRAGVGSAGRAVAGIKNAVTAAARGAFDSLWSAFTSVYNRIVGAWNRLRFKMPSIDTKLPGVGKVGGFDVGVPQIPTIRSGAPGMKASSGGPVTVNVSVDNRGGGVLNTRRLAEDVGKAVETAMTVGTRGRAVRGVKVRTV